MNIHSLVSSEKLRFDFSHNKQITSDDINKIQDEVNSVIKTTSKSNIAIKSQEDAIKAGAIALFGEKYGDEVRVVTLGSKNDNPYSIELCGGTHVKDVTEINKFLIVNEESVSSGVRRIEALTFNKVDEYLFIRSKEKEKLEIQQNENINDLEKQIKDLSGQINFQDSNKAVYIKKLENYLNSLKNKSILSNDSNNQITVDEINGVNYITQVIEGLPPNCLLYTSPSPRD